VPRISVVVPIYNVESYLGECLRSLQAQTYEDWEAVLVDDGSTDGSHAIAEEFAAADRRLRVVQQANAGLSAARNTGIDAAGGEFLVFLDSDDMLPPRAYELLLAALDQTGSDFASGNVHRITRWDVTQARFLAKAFAQTRMKTHVTRFRELLADRTAWNKLWRRSFWDAHAMRFPEGVVHEDIPIVVPAHFRARSVDVLADPVYLYRVRELGDLSITQRRLEPRVMLDRLAAVEQVSDYLAAEQSARSERWYHRSVLLEDLRYHLDLLDAGDEEYRALFMDRVRAFLARVDKRVLSTLPAIHRLKWHLVGRGREAELMEVLRFEREDLAQTPPVRVRGRWYGDYPFRNDRRLRIPPSVYRLRSELGLSATIERLRLEDGRLDVEGHAYVEELGAPRRGSQRVTLSAVAPGRLRPFAVRTTPARARADECARPDVTAATDEPAVDPTWSGFTGSLDIGRMLRMSRGEDRAWELYVTVRNGLLTRRRMRFSFTDAVPPPAVEERAAGGRLVRVVPKESGEVVVEARGEWAALTGHGLDDDALVLTGEARLADGGDVTLRLRPGEGSKARSYPATLAGTTFSARVPLADLGGPAGSWTLALGQGKRRLPLRQPAGVADAAWPLAGAEVALSRTQDGNAELAVRAARPVLTDARWAADGVLEIAGDAAPGGGAHELLLVRRDGSEHYVCASESAGARFRARLTPGAVQSLAGVLPLGKGAWELRARPAEGGGDVPVAVATALRASLPLRDVVARKGFALTVSQEGGACLIAERDLDDDERGSFHALRLRQVAYAARRRRPLRDAVVYSSFDGRQYSDSPRAIHEELVRRGAGLEHLWIVDDARCRVPDTATVVRKGSREHFEALACSRYVVFNDTFPDWFERRPDQVCVQTWHGAPLKRLGLDAPGVQRRLRRYEMRWSRQIVNWQHLVSPSRFATPILRRAYGIEGDVLETGAPRQDVLAGAGRDDRARAVRERLGLADGVRAVLYAPTYRDHVVDRLGRHRLDLRLDLDRLRAALGHDAVVLVRRHPRVTGAVPASADGFVRDVTSYPDATELLLAADVLVTDYSSLMFDFANTGRPMLFYTYDLEAYRDRIRGLYIDLEAEAPGPLLATSDAVAEALGDLDAVRAAHADRYAAFVARYCELDDGHAAARVVDGVLGG
jgi:CDP-glycerol glycerophosphotransferase